MDIYFFDNNSSTGENFLSEDFQLTLNEVVSGKRYITFCENEKRENQFSFRVVNNEIYPIINDKPPGLEISTPDAMIFNARA